MGLCDEGVWVMFGGEAEAVAAIPPPDCLSDEPARPAAG